MTLQSCGSSAPIYKINDISENYKAEEIVNDFYNEDAKLGYTILKDGSFVYINLSTAEASTQLKILQNGVKLFIDEKGKEKKTSYIQYPLEADIKEKLNLGVFVKDKASFINDKIAVLDNNIAIIKNESRSLINRNLNNQNISTEIKLVDQELYYQMIIPIDYFNTNSGKLASLGISIKGLSIKLPQSNQNARGGGSRGSGATRGSGGRSRGGGGNTNTGSSNVSKKTPSPSRQIQGLTSDALIWLKLDLTKSA